MNLYVKHFNIFLVFILSVFSIHSAAQNVECEDTCQHIHGIDISHYQGDIFWETIGENSSMAYVYIKASEGGDRKDHRFEENIKMAHKHGVKVGSYHFYRCKTPQEVQLRNFMEQCHPDEQDLIPMIDVETTSGLPTEQFCDSLFKSFKFFCIGSDLKFFFFHLFRDTFKIFFKISCFSCFYKQNSILSL